MPVFEKSVPELPENIGNYVIIYKSSSDEYILKPYVEDVYIEGENLKLYCRARNDYRCNSYSSAWSLHNYPMGMDSDLPLSDINIVYSSYDICYRDTGEVYYYQGGAVEGLVLNENLSSSTIYNTLFDNILPVFSIVVVAVILFLGFRKAWRFVTGAVRGA